MLAPSQNVLERVCTSTAGPVLRGLPKDPLLILPSSSIAARAAHPGLELLLVRLMLLSVVLFPSLKMITIDV
jgi:hypothetical protein